MADDPTIATYSAMAPRYTELETTEAQDQALELFLGRLPRGGSILDLGCGPGLQAAQMLAAGFEVSGLDATQAFVDHARSLGVNARLGFFDDLTEVAAYDGVWASFSLLHAPKAAFPRHLTAIARALKPGGRLHLALKLGVGEARDDLGRFYAYYLEDELTDLLADAGFRVTDRTLGQGIGLAGTCDPFILLNAHA